MSDNLFTSSEMLSCACRYRDPGDPDATIPGDWPVLDKDGTLSPAAWVCEMVESCDADRPGFERIRRLA